MRDRLRVGLTLLILSSAAVSLPSARWCLADDPDLQRAGKVVAVTRATDSTQPASAAATRPARATTSTGPAARIAASGPRLWTTRPATGPPATAQATQPVNTIEEARALYQKGDYASAVAGYRKFLSQDSLAVAAAVGLAEAMSMQGQYGGAIQALEKVAPRGAASPPWRLAMAEALSTVGRYDEALGQAVKANQLRPDWAAAILLRGQLLETLGRKGEAAAVYKTMDKAIATDDYRKDAAALVALGKVLDRFAVLTGRKASEQAQNILHNYFQEAYQRVDERYWPANVAAGMFLLSKHRPEEAVREFQLAAKINKRLPDVCVGMGIAELGRWNFEGCMAQADAALKINPEHADALLLKATCLMQWRKYDQAPPVLEAALKTNPNHPDALSLMAAWCVLKGGKDQAGPYIARVEKINPRCAELPNTIGQWLSAGRQFDQAEPYFRRAIELAPEQAEPLTNLGLMYMQTGEEDKARDILQQAQKLDDFRADVVNFLKLLDKLEKFDVKESEHFIVKVDKAYDEILADQVSAYMDRVYAEVCRDFSHEPAGKTIIEIFPTHDQFSVRITGKGWIGTVGASTGRVIVLVAPNKERSEFGTYNWATVLRHEFTHTVTLSATHNRIPHWFTEACAVWEQPDRRNYEAVQALVLATQTDRLFPVKELDWGFIRPKRGNDRGLAYAQAEWMMEYVIAARGFETIRKMLEGFGDRMAQAEVFQKVLGVSEEQFDKDFKAWARTQVSSWGFNPDPILDVAKTAREAREKPKDAAAQANYAVALYNRRNAAEAQKAAGKALELDAKNVRALGVLARILAIEQRHDEAIEMAQRLEEADHTSRVAPRVLADGYLAKHRWADAIAALDLLQKRMPLDPYSYQQLAKIYIQLGQTARALPNLRELHQRTMTDSTYARQIAELYRASNDVDGALEYYEQLIHINPYDPSAYLAEAALYKNSRRYDQAIAAVRNVCLLQGDSAEAWDSLARILYLAGRAAQDKAKLQEARQAAQKALRLDGESPTAKETIGAIDALLKE